MSPNILDRTGSDPAPVPETRRRLAILVCSEFGSDNAGSHRQERWARHYLAVCDGIIVHFPVGRMQCAEQRFDSVAELDAFRQQIRQTVDPGRTSRSGTVARVLRAVKYFLLAEFLVPRNYALALRLGLRLFAEANVTAVHVSSPPFPFAFFATLVTKVLRPGAKVHIDMRDPWATHQTLGGFKSVKAFIERRILRAADVVTTATAFMASETRSFHGVSARPVYNIATHVLRNNDDVEGRSERVARTSALPRIVYAGTMPEGFYDIRRLAEWLVAASRSELLRQYEWFFIGECSPLESELRARIGESANVRFSGRVSHEKAVAAMMSADALLFLGHRFPGYLTTKLFEYISLAKPILPLFLDSSAEAYAVIRRLCGSCPEIDTFDDLQVALGNFEILPHLRNPEALYEMARDYVIISGAVMESPAGEVKE